MDYSQFPSRRVPFRKGDGRTRGGSTRGAGVVPWLEGGAGRCDWIGWEIGWAGGAGWADGAGWTGGAGWADGAAIWVDDVGCNSGTAWASDSRGDGSRVDGWERGRTRICSLGTDLPSVLGGMSISVRSLRLTVELRPDWDLGGELLSISTLRVRVILLDSRREPPPTCSPFEGAKPKPPYELFRKCQLQNQWIWLQ